MKNKTIFAVTMMFIITVLALTPLLAQDATEAINAIDTVSIADTAKYLEKTITDESKKTSQNKTFFDLVYWWCFTEFITSITHNEPVSFDRIYNRVLEGSGRNSIKVFISSVFASFEFIDDGIEQNMLTEAISSQNDDVFVEVYEKLSDTDKQKLLKLIFSHLKIKDDWEKNYSKVMDYFRQKYKE